MQALISLGRLTLRLSQVVILLSSECLMVASLTAAAWRLPGGLGGGLASLPAPVALMLCAGLLIHVTELIVSGTLILRLLYAGARLHRWVRDHRTTISARVTPLAEEVLGDRPVVQVVSHGVFALTYGLLRPRVVVSTGLLERVTDAELAAVLRHERHHAERFDLLQRLVVSLVRVTLWFGIGNPRLRHQHRRCQELAADRAALRGSQPGAVAGALLKVADGPRFGTAAAGMHDGDVLEARVEQLETSTCTGHGLPPQSRHVACAALVLGGLVAKLYLVAQLSWLACHLHT